MTTSDHHDRGKGYVVAAPEEAHGTTLIRALNLQAVLDAVLEAGQISRPEAAEATGLSLPTVSSLMADLEAMSLVVARGHVAQGLGRPAALYSVNGRAGYVFAVDLGAESVTAGIADFFGEVLTKRTKATASDSPEATVDQLTRLHEELVDEAGFNIADAGVGCVGLPGVWPPDQEHAAKVVTMPWLREYPLRTQLRTELGIPVILENDANLAAIAELWRGRAQGCSNFVTISVGAGTGMGIIVDGETYRGSAGAAGELALLPVGPDPYDRTVGARGAFQAAAAGPSIVQRLHAAIEAGAKTSLDHQSRAVDILAAARSGDPVARQALADEAKTLALGVVAAIAILNPEVIVLGGAIGSDPDLVESVRHHAAGLIENLPHITPSALADQAVLQGAVAVALQSVRSRILAGLHTTK